MTALLLGGPAFAQAQAENQSANTNAASNELEEVVVTATRQTDTVNRVPLSITAQTQRTLDQRGIRSIQDLQSTVPALRVTQAAGSGTASVAIRGIIQTSNGAATTGLYLDETPLQRRNTSATAAVNGTPLPGLFDLDRIEVLRGPQGTLFGGSSEGGTIRYIQPSPSLTRYSVYGRAQISSTRYGDPSYETSLAGGGPIIQDKLGFRLAFSNIENGGYLDLINPISNQLIAKDTNKSYQQSLRAALAWQVTDRLRAQFSVLRSRSSDKDTSTAQNLSTDFPLTVPTLCYNANNTPLLGNFNAAGMNTGPRVGPITAQPFTSAARTTPNPVARGDAACNAARAAGDWTYQTPGYSLGPYHLEPNQRLGTETSQARTRLTVAALDLTYDFEKMSVKSITSFIEDKSASSSTQAFQTNRVPIGNSGNTGGAAVNAMYGAIIIPSGINFPVLPGIGAAYTGPARFTSINQRLGVVQELRFSSSGDARPLSWVGGVFFSNIHSTTQPTLYGQSDVYSLAQYGITEVQRYTVAGIQSRPGGPRDIFAKQYQLTKDVDIAAFGEVNYWLTEQLRLTAGIRVTRTTFDFDFTEVGQSVAVGPDSPNPAFRQPTLANNARFIGSVSESPVTPKAALQYNVTPTSLVYLSASKGYRSGGVTTPVPQAAAGDSLGRNFAGATVFDLPRTYKSDSVWSYEVGAKVRLFNRVQINAAAYRIDWNDTQFSVSIPQSGQSFITNVAGARSQGVEGELEAKIFRGLTGYVNAGYNKAKYTEAFNATLGNGASIPTVLKDQPFAQPKLTLSAGGRYDVQISETARLYVRGDWRYTGKYENSPFGTVNWNPDSNVFPSFQVTNVRFGIEYGDFDLNLFVNNVFQRDSGNVTGGRTGCLLPAAGGTEACTTFGAYDPLRTVSLGRPREIGLQLAYRH